MKYRMLGKSGIKVSEIGYGCGGVWGLNFVSEKKAINLVRLAIENGVTLFDTGASYSNGQAEIRLGKAIKHIDREKLVIASKAGTHIGKNGKLYKDFSPSAIDKSVKNSLMKLQVDYLDILQLHSPSLNQIGEDTLGKLRELKEQKLIKAIGVSGDSELVDWVISNANFDCIMLTYNVIHQKPISQIKRANLQGIGVLLKSPLAHSLYSNKILKVNSLRTLWYFLRILKNYRNAFFQGRKLKFINHINGKNPHDLALQFVLNSPEVSSAVIGTTNAQHLRDNLAVSGNQIDDHIYNQIITAMK